MSPTAQTEAADQGSARDHDQSTCAATPKSAAPRIDVSHNVGGYDDISTVYAYYTPALKAAHGKHCDWWSAMSNLWPSRGEGDWIAKVEAENPGQFSHYLISWSGCE